MKAKFLVRLSKLIGLGIVGLLVIGIIALDLLDDNRTFESPSLLTVLNAVFLTSLSLATAVISILIYIRLGLLRFLVLGIGSVAFGLTALLAGPLMISYGANIPITIYNIGSLLSAICYSFTMMRFVSISLAGKTPKRRLLISFVALFITLFVIGILVHFSVHQAFPSFFTQGTGSTPIRQVILGLTILLMGSTAIYVYRDYKETRTGFNYWFSLGIFCIALGFIGVYNMTVSGNALNWAARFSQYVGNSYLLFASIVSLQRFYSNSIANEDLIATLFQEPALNYRLIMDTDPNGVAVVNDQGRILRWNCAAERLFGYSNEEAAGSFLAHLIFPQHRDAIEQSLKLLQEQPGEYTNITMDLVARCKDACTLPILFSISGTMTSLGWMGVSTIHDISKRTKAEQELAHYTAKLEVTNKELESFAYSISHDFRTPLRTLDSFSEMVLMEYGDKMDETCKNYLTRIRKASQTMSTLTKDFLKLFEITSTEMHIEKVNLSELVYSVVDELMQIRSDRLVDFIIEPGMTVYGDKALLQILMHNLLENSWKYTSNRTDARIEAGVLKQGKERVYYTRDNGIGFDMKYYDKLFEPFQRLHHDKQYSGNGIGLATAQRIIQRHGGRVWAESWPINMTTFYFTLGEVEDNVNA